MEELVSTSSGYSYDLPAGLEIPPLDPKEENDMHVFSQRLYTPDHANEIPLSVMNKGVDRLYKKLENDDIKPPKWYGRALLMMVRKESRGCTVALGSNLKDVGPLQFIPPTAKEFFRDGAVIDQEGLEKYFDGLPRKDSTISAMVSSDASSLTDWLQHHADWNQRIEFFSYLDQQSVIIQDLQKIDSRFVREDSVYALVAYQHYIAKKILSQSERVGLDINDDVFWLLVLNAHNTGATNIINDVLDKLPDGYFDGTQESGINLLRTIYQMDTVGLSKQQKNYIFRLMELYVTKESYLLTLDESDTLNASSLSGQKDAKWGLKHVLYSLLGGGVGTYTYQKTTRRSFIKALGMIGGGVGLGPLIYLHEKNQYESSLYHKWRDI